MSKLINATPRNINICDKNGTCIRTIEKTNICVRCPEQIEIVGMVDGIELITKKFVGIDGLPSETHGVAYIASLPVAQAGKVLGRKDLYIPGAIVRNDAGQIVGCMNLAIV